MYAVIDMETTINSPISSPSFPMWPLNRVVLAGARVDGVNYICNGGAARTSGLPIQQFIDLINSDDVDVLVGHNIKFDLLYALRNKWITPKRLMKIKLWDTQLAEYLLSVFTRGFE